MRTTTRSRSTAPTSSSTFIAIRNPAWCSRSRSATGRTAPNRADRCSATLEAWAEEDRAHMAFSDRGGSTWRELKVVSWQLTSAEAQAGPLREAFLRMADHIVYQDRRLRRALSRGAPAQGL